jgi:hypothetical protein
MTVGDRTYEACPIRRRRTKADMARVRQAIHDVIAEDPPMTVRQVFYRLVVAGAVEKTEAAYQGTVIRLLTEMRLDGDIPFDWIIDESRRRRITETYDSVADALEQTARFYRRSALQQADDYIEIRCEKDALSGSIWQVTSRYDVPLMISRGMPSLTFLHGTAQEVQRAAEAGKETFIYQFGDHDPSGVLTASRRTRGVCPTMHARPDRTTRKAAAMGRKKNPTDSDQLAYYAVRLLEITAEMRPNERSSYPAMITWDIRTELLTVISRLTDVQARLMDRIYKDRP